MRAARAEGFDKITLETTPDGGLRIGCQQSDELAESKEVGTYE